MPKIQTSTTNVRKLSSYILPNNICIDKLTLKTSYLSVILSYFTKIQTFECKMRQFFDLFAQKNSDIGPKFEKIRPFGNTGIQNSEI